MWSDQINKVIQLINALSPSVLDFLIREQFLDNGELGFSFTVAAISLGSPVRSELTLVLSNFDEISLDVVSVVLHAASPLVRFQRLIVQGFVRDLPFGESLAELILR